MKKQKRSNILNNQNKDLCCVEIACTTGSEWSTAGPPRDNTGALFPQGASMSHNTQTNTHYLPEHAPASQRKVALALEVLLPCVMLVPVRGGKGQSSRSSHMRNRRLFLAGRWGGSNAIPNILAHLAR